ncbi:hypothetical protein Golomagni_06217, partial [Golovinomyces magnicellulatus]
RSSRRAGGLRPTDYDHEIDIVDHERSRANQTQNLEPQVTRTDTNSRLLRFGRDRRHSRQDLSSLDSRQQFGNSSADQTNDPTPNRSPDNSDGEDDDENEAQDTDGPSNHHIQPSDTQPTIGIQAPTPAAIEDEPPTSSNNNKSTKSANKRETAVDILYENERGGFLCGSAMFSYKLLGGLDPTPWTNEFHMPSLTNVETAQLPDPSWEWISPEWKIHYQDGVDEFGWHYSFAFSNKFSWHKAKWWNSFVRRRAWVRRRAKKRAEDISSDPHMLNADYFTVKPASQRKRQSAGSLGSRVSSKTSISYMSSISDEDRKVDIEDLVTLMQVLRLSRIDREKREAIENYLEHATDIESLHVEMHEIMSLFIFQASRRLLLGHLMEKHAEATKKLEKAESQEMKTRKDALDAAIKHADEEVRKLAYWSDVKAMVATGESRLSLEEDKRCFYDTYEGIDGSGPLPPNEGKLPGQEQGHSDL